MTTEGTHGQATEATAAALCEKRKAGADRLTPEERALLVGTMALAADIEPGDVQGYRCPEYLSFTPGAGSTTSAGLFTVNSNILLAFYCALNPNDPKCR